jgi:small GTP-binding protein
MQKKICMVGVFGTGKTCLVQRYVHSIFSAKYLSTVGVKIDKKEVAAGGQSVTLMLWDLEGRDAVREINTSYLRGAHGLIYVVDGTRRETFDQMFAIRDQAERELGELPSVIAFNKADLAAEWQIGPKDEQHGDLQRYHRLRTSAKTGEGVDAAFTWLAAATIGAHGA